MRFLFMAVIVVFLSSAADLRAEQPHFFAPSCAAYSGLFAKIVAETSPPSNQEVADFATFSGMAIGYASAVRDLMGSDIPALLKSGTELSLLQEIDTLCLKEKGLSFEEALRRATGADRFIAARKERKRRP